MVIISRTAIDKELGLVGIVQKTQTDKTYKEQRIPLFEPHLIVEVFDLSSPFESERGLDRIHKLRNEALADSYHAYEIQPHMSTGYAHAIAYNRYRIRS